MNTPHPMLNLILGVAIIVPPQEPARAPKERHDDRPRLVAMLGHDSGVQSAAISPDGLLILTVGGLDNTARLWHAETGRELRTFPAGAYIGVAAFSPDGDRILVGNKVWDVQSGQLLRTVMGDAYADGISVDWKQAYRVRANLAVCQVIDPESGQILRSFGSLVELAALSPDGKFVACSGDSDAQTFNSAVFSADGKRVVTASVDRTARIWDANTGKEIRRLEGHAMGVTSASYSSDGKRIVTTSSDKSARIWDAYTGKGIRRFEGHAAIVWMASFSPDTNRVVTASEDKTVRIWDANTGKETLRLEGHSEPVFSASFSSDGKRLVTAGKDKTVRVWGAENGKEILRLEGHSEGVLSASFSPDGIKIVTASEDRTARIWDAITGKEIVRMSGHESGVLWASLSPNGKRLATTSADKTARIWNAETGEQISSLEGHAVSVWEVESAREVTQLKWHDCPVTTMAFSADGKLLMTGSEDDSARIWNVQTGKQIRRLTGHGGRVTAIAFARDSLTALTAGKDNIVRVWDVATGREIRSVRSDGPIRQVTFFPDQERVLIRSGPDKVWIWDAKSTSEPGKFEGGVARPSGVAFSDDGKYLLTGDWKGTTHLWDVRFGSEIRRFEQHSHFVGAMALLPDNTRLVTGSGDGSVRLWDVASGREIRRFMEDFGSGDSVAISVDGKRLLAASRTHRFHLPGGSLPAVYLWEIESGKELLSLNSDLWIEQAAFSSDGQSILLLSELKAEHWNASTGVKLREFGRESSDFLFSSNGKWGLVLRREKEDRDRIGSVGVWDIQAGTEVRQVRVGKSVPILIAIALSNDGGRALLRTSQGIVLWDTVQGRAIREFEGFPDGIQRGIVKFSPDGKKLLIPRHDGTTSVFSLETGRQLCSLISFRDGTWAVIDSEGRYDASNGGDVEGLHWVMGMEPIELSQFKDLYYDPGLLAKKLGFSPEKPREVPSLENIKLYPKTFAKLNPDQSSAKISLVAREGGGIGKYRVLLNGAVIHEGQAPPGVQKHEFVLDLKPFAKRLVPKSELAEGQQNKLTVFAYNAANSLSSRGGEFEVPAPDRPVEPPRLFALCAGVSDYEGTRLDLRYASKDAVDFGKALEFTAGKLLGKDRVKVTILATDKSPSGFPDASSYNIRKELERISQEAASTDVVIVYLSGHGVGKAGSDEDYFYLTKEAGLADLDRPETRAQLTLSGKELSDALAKIPANKQAVILDTCASGTLIDDVSKGRAVSSELKRAWERLKDRAGVFVLAGCAADAVSYEATNLGHGLLTYSLLEPLGKVDPQVLELNKDGTFQVDLTRWLQSSERRVEELIREFGLGGIQRPELKSRAKAQSFPVGLLEKGDTGKIALEQPKPVILLREFETADREDPLALTDALNSALLQPSAKGSPDLAYWPLIREHPKAYALTGAYAVSGESVQVEVRIQAFVEVDGKLQRKTVDTFNASGPKGDLAVLSAKILSEAGTRLQKLREKQDTRVPPVSLSTLGRLDTNEMGIRFETIMKIGVVA